MSSSNSIILAFALAVTAPSIAVAAGPHDSLAKIVSQKHHALASPSDKESKWLIFPQQQDIHSQTLGGSSSFQSIHDKVSPNSFFKDHAEALGLDQQAEFTKYKHFKANSGSITHQKYHQSISNIPVYGGDFHLTLGSHNGGKYLLQHHLYCKLNREYGHKCRHIVLYHPQVYLFAYHCSDECQWVCSESFRYCET